MIERITHAAIRYTDLADSSAHVATARRHGECFAAMRSAGIRYNKETAAQGFATSDGRFVDRKEATAIARKAGQIPQEFHRDFLVSEDLW